MRLAHHTDICRTALALLLVALGVASPVGAGNLPDPAAAKAADKCQATFTKSGAKFTSKTLKSLEKCYDAVFKCIQTKPGDQKCLDKAIAKCAKESGKVAKERTKLTDAIVKRCPTDPADLTGALGLGFDALATECNDDFGISLTDVASIAACVREQHECQAEEAFNLHMPRAGGFADALAIGVRPGTCLRDLGGTGGDVGDPGLGKALDKCQKEAKKAGAKFIASKLKSLQRCVGAHFKCVQTKPGDQKCLDKATAKCDKELVANVAKAAAKLEKSLTKRCDEIHADARADAGMHVDGLAGRCLDVGVNTIDAPSDYRLCMFQQLSCLAEEMVHFQAPRAEALLQSVGHELHSPFCAAEGEILIGVTRRGGGAGTVTSTPLGIDCGPSGPTCVAAFPGGPSVELHARTVNGSDSYFQVWDGACGGGFHDCTVSTGESQAVEAYFAPQTFNLVFSTQERFDVTLGAGDPNDPTAPYDDECNQLATAAGINNLTDDGFTAFLSSTVQTISDRLAPARGFVRMDGKPFADELADLFSANEIFNTVELGEDGATNENSPQVMTGTGPTGTVTPNCTDYSQTVSGLLSTGHAHKGPTSWTAEGGFGCNVVTTGSVYCFGNSKNAELVPAGVPGKMIYMTNTPFLVGVDDPDTKCTAEKPAGAGAVKALLPTTTTAAASVLADGQTYVRPDGQVVGTKEQIIATALAPTAATRLQSGIWQSGDGTYRDGTVITGAADIIAPATVAETCDDWTDDAAPDSTGASLVANTGFGFWKPGIASPCNVTTRHIYCVEQ